MISAEYLSHCDVGDAKATPARLLDCTHRLSYTFAIDLGLPSHAHRVTKSPRLRVVIVSSLPYIGIRGVGAGKRLANLVRSGRKQPQRAPLGSMSNLSLYKKPRLWRVFLSLGVCPHLPNTIEPQGWFCTCSKIFVDESAARSLPLLEMVFVSLSEDGMKREYGEVRAYAPPSP